MRIIHLSDLHVSSQLYYVPEWGQKVVDLVNGMEADVLIVSGDLVYYGLMHEYAEAREYLDQLKVKNRLIVPGNHDSRNEGYKIFEDLFETRFPFYENDLVQILGIDSSEPDISDGHIGREKYSLIEKSLDSEDKIRMLILHHHLIPIPGTGRERNIPYDAGDALKLVTNLGIDFVLSGHKHKPWIWHLEDTFFVTAGTATTQRLKGISYPSFNVMDIDEESLVLTEYNVRDDIEEERLRLSRN